MLKGKLKKGFGGWNKNLKSSWGGFHKSWAQGVKRKAHPNLIENAISWA